MRVLTVCLLGAFSLAGGALAADSRVIVSSTLDSSLLFFNARTLEEGQPPLLSRGGGPVRLWVQSFEGKPYLFAANHGAALGSVGAFDLSGDLVTELALSPFPARSGSVGVAAGVVSVSGKSVAMVFVSNTFFALAPCGVPNGSVTAYDASLLGTAGLLEEIGTVDVSGAIPYAVSVDPADALAFVTSNCAATLTTVGIEASGLPLPADAPLPARFRISKTATRSTGAGPDAVLFDAARRRVYVNDIGGDGLSVFDPTTPEALTTVPLSGAGPIDATLADSYAGHHWVITSNGKDDSVSLIDRERIEGCALSSPPSASCPQAEVLRVLTGVKGGAPEGVAYDPATSRVFAVNKYPIGSPSLSVIQIIEAPGQNPAGAVLKTIPLGALGAAAPVPALIAFDVVVQTR